MIVAPIPLNWKKLVFAMPPTFRGKPALRLEDKSANPARGEPAGPNRDQAINHQALNKE
jgi:hypothetical protein